MSQRLTRLLDAKTILVVFCSEIETKIACSRSAVFVAVHATYLISFGGLYRELSAIFAATAVFAMFVAPGFFFRPDRRSIWLLQRQNGRDGSGGQRAVTNDR